MKKKQVDSPKKNHSGGPYQDRISKNIRRLRAERGWPVSFVAKALNCSTQWVYYIESGERAITTRTIARLAQIFGVDPAVLSHNPKAKTATDEAALFQSQYTVQVAPKQRKGLS